MCVCVCACVHEHAFEQLTHRAVHLFPFIAFVSVNAGPYGKKPIVYAGTVSHLSLLSCSTRHKDISGTKFLRGAETDLT